jgi:hypothetical protein
MTDMPVWFYGLITLIGGALTVAFACRVRLLSVSQHRAPVWLVHVAGLLSCGWITLDAAANQFVDVTNLAVLVMGFAHIWGTYYSWAGGVPDHAVAKRTAGAEVGA